MKKDELYDLLESERGEHELVKQKNLDLKKENKRLRDSHMGAFDWGMSLEVKAYQEQEEFLRENHYAAWVIFYNQKLQKIFESFVDAVIYAHEKFGNGPYLIRRVGGSKQSFFMPVIWPFNNLIPSENKPPATEGYCLVSYHLNEDQTIRSFKTEEEAIIEAKRRGLIWFEILKERMK